MKKILLLIGIVLIAGCFNDDNQAVCKDFKLGYAEGYDVGYGAGYSACLEDIIPTGELISEEVIHETTTTIPAIKECVNLCQEVLLSNKRLKIYGANLSNCLFHLEFTPTGKTSVKLGRCDVVCKEACKELHQEEPTTTIPTPPNCAELSDGRMICLNKSIDKIIVLDESQTTTTIPLTASFSDPNDCIKLGGDIVGWRCEGDDLLGIFEITNHSCCKRETITTIPNPYKYCSPSCNPANETHWVRYRSNFQENSYVKWFTERNPTILEGEPYVLVEPPTTTIPITNVPPENATLPLFSVVDEVPPYFQIGCNKSTQICDIGCTGIFNTTLPLHSMITSLWEIPAPYQKVCYLINNQTLTTLWIYSGIDSCEEIGLLSNISITLTQKQEQTTTTIHYGEYIGKCEALNVCVYFENYTKCVETYKECGYLRNETITLTHDVNKEIINLWTHITTLVHDVSRNTIYITTTTIPETKE